MADATPDYRKTHFETSTLTKCEGEPTFDVILNWHNILKANAAKVHTGLFGGNHGYLALLLSAAAYALISPANNIRPLHPGALLIPANTTQHMAMTMKDAHKEALRVFRECQGVEAAFQQMLVEACEPIYLEALRDATTRLFSISTILTELFPRKRSRKKESKSKTFNSIQTSQSMSSSTKSKSLRTFWKQLGLH